MAAAAAVAAAEAEADAAAAAAAEAEAAAGGEGQGSPGGGGGLRRASVRLLVEKYEEGGSGGEGGPPGAPGSPGAGGGAGRAPPAAGGPPASAAEDGCWGGEDAEEGGSDGGGGGPLEGPLGGGRGAAPCPAPAGGVDYDVPVTPEVGINFMRSPSFVNSPSFSGGSTPGLSPPPPPAQPSATPEFSVPKVLQRSRSDDAERLSAGVTLAAVGARAPGPEGHRVSSASTASFGLGGPGALLRDSVQAPLRPEGHAGPGGGGDFVSVSISADGLPFSPAKVAAGGLGKAGAERAAGDVEAAGACAGAGALSQSQIEPFKFPSDVKARVEALGTDLADIQKVLLWTGILLDIVGKSLLIVEMTRFANRDNWEWFSFIFLFLVVSGSMTTMYWMAHYTWDEDKTRQDTVAIFGWTKNDVKRLIRRMGAVCAIFQLGTAFAALRALRTKEHKKKAAAMDLKGMRLVDTVFLSLAMSGLQAYIGMACSSPEASCPGRVGFDGILMVSIVSSLLSATICFVALDLKDDWRRNRQHRCEMGCFIPYRFAELSARITTMALFAAIHHAWVFFVILAHAAVVLVALRRYPGANRESVLGKLGKMRRASFLGLPLRLPVFDDAKLLLVCLAWQPSCFVSDATDPQGHFWWRARFDKQPKRGKFSSMDPSEAVLPFSLFNLIVGAEAGLILLACYFTLPSWADGFFNIAFACVVLWLFFSLSYVSVRYQAALGEVKGEDGRPRPPPPALSGGEGPPPAGGEPVPGGKELPPARGPRHSRNASKDSSFAGALEGAEARTPFRSIGNQLSRGESAAPASDGPPVGDVRASGAQSYLSEQLPQRSPGFLWKANPNPAHSFNEFS